MLKITIPANEMWDEKNEEFVSIKETTLSLEHSLVSISKWESKFKKSFISSKERTPEEILEYIKFMTLTQNVPEIVYSFLTKENIDEINNYIADPMTATTFSDKSKKRNNRIITSELIYYWMFANQIPKECEKWHINRLMTLIGVFGAENNQEKMSKKDLAKKYASLNAARRRASGSKG